MDRLEEYWVGKSPIIRKAFEEWWFDKEGKTKIEVLVKKYGCSKAQIVKASHDYRLMGFETINPNSMHSKKYKARSNCLLCGVSTTGLYPKYRLTPIFNSRDIDSIYGYICKSCLDKIEVKRYT